MTQSNDSNRLDRIEQILESNARATSANTEAIANGVAKPNPHFDKSMNRHRKDLEHPEKTNFDGIRNKLAGFE